MKRIHAGSMHQIDHIGFLHQDEGSDNFNPVSADKVLVIGVLPPPVGRCRCMEMGSGQANHLIFLIIIL